MAVSLLIYRRIFMKKARLLSIFLSLVCTIGLVACGGASTPAQSGEAQVTTLAETAAAEETQAEEQSETTELDESEAQSDDDEHDEEAFVLTDDMKIVYFANFENDDISAFTTRGENDTTKLSISTEFARNGQKSLMASGRTESWNGPAFKLDELCKPGKEYYLNASVMQRDHKPVTLSFQYTDQAGEVHYSNLMEKSGKKWLAFNQVNIGFTDDMTDVYVYFEGGTEDIFVDGFSVVEAPAVGIEEELASLCELYKDDFKVGTAITPADLSSKGFMSLLEKHFSASITIGNEMKPDYVLDRNATLENFEKTGNDEDVCVSFAAAKPALDYCRDNKIPVRVHTLVWHSQTPLWFFKEGFDPDGEWVSKEKMTKRMENYIKHYFETLTELYPDIDFYACDVVNEAWLENGGYRKAGTLKEGGDRSMWVKVYGDNSFIEDAFTYARKYAPKGCKLYYNDYNEYMDGKLKAIVDMAKDLKEKGLIDGIGMQSHLDVRQGADAFPSVAMYDHALDVYSELGLDIQVTELDATVPLSSRDKYFEAQAEYYKGIMSSIYAHKDHVSAMIFWGITDDRSWRNTQLPLIFDKNFKAKPAYYTIAAVKEDK